MSPRQFALCTVAVAAFSACSSDVVSLRRSSPVPPAPTAAPSATPTVAPSATPTPSPTPTSAPLKVTEYSLAGVPADANPYGITSGPDGALWFTDGIYSYIGRLTTAGAFTRFPLPSTLQNAAFDIHTESDGNLWFTAEQSLLQATAVIGTISTGGVVTVKASFPNVGDNYITFAQGSDGANWLVSNVAGGQNVERVALDGTASAFPVNLGSQHFIEDVASGPDGALWFVDALSSDLVRVTTSGAVTTVALPGASSPLFLNGITVGPDGAFWLGTLTPNVGRFTTTGSYSQYSVPANATGSPSSQSVCTGADNAVYFTSNGGAIIGRISTSGVVTEYPLSSPQSQTHECTLGPDGAIWFTENNGKIGRLG